MGFKMKKMQRANQHIELLTFQRLSFISVLLLRSEEMPQRPTTDVPSAKSDFANKVANAMTWLSSFLLFWFYSAKEFLAETQAPIRQRTIANIQLSFKTKIVPYIPLLKQMGFTALIS